MSLTAVSLFAQAKYAGGKERGMGMHNPIQHLNMMQKKLDLTDAQVDKMYKIHKDYMNKYYEAKNDSDKKRALREKQFSEIKSVLTAEQQKKWDEFAKDRPSKKDGKDQNRSDKKGEKKFGKHGFMHDKLNLTDEQSAKIHKIHKDNMDNFYKNRKHNDKIKELTEKQKAEIEKILTPEQIAKMKEFKEKRPEHHKDWKKNGSKKGKNN